MTGNRAPGTARQASPVRLTEEEAALATDAYIETLLAPAGVAGSPGPASTARVDLDTARAVDALSDGLVRFHPSFRFEERLASRIRDAARGRVAAGTSWVPGEAPPLFGSRAVPDIGRALPGTGRSLPDIGREVGRALPDLGREVGRAVERVERVPVPVLVGGAIASGVSLAGAAIVAWRLSRRPLVPRLP